MAFGSYLKIQHVANKNLLKSIFWGENWVPYISTFAAGCLDLHAVSTGIFIIAIINTWEVCLVKTN
jgi:hypothetical protein